MRTIFLLLFLISCTVPVWPQSHQGKKVTINLANITLEEALTVLSISYGVDFSYSDNVVPVNKMVNLTINDEELADALTKLLTDFNLDYKISRNRVLLKRASIVLTNTIRGIVTDETTTLPILGATVVVRNQSTNMGCATDSLGRFKLQGVPVGRVSIAISCIGYNNRTIENILLGTGKELVLEIKISEAVTSMDEVVIKAQKHETLPGDGVALTSSKSFTVEESKRYAGSMGDPARMVTAFAGVTSASDENNALIIRGNSPRGLLWRIEGIEVPNPNHFTTEGSSGGIVSVLSPNVIESAEFLTGAFPAQYGNALAGVFDMRLRNGNNEKDEYSIQAGMLGMEVSAEGPFNKHKTSSYLVNYRYSTLSILDKLNFDLNEVGQYKDYQDLSFKMNIPMSKAGDFSVFGIGGKSSANKRRENVFDDSDSDLGILGITYRSNAGERGYIQGAMSWAGTQITRDTEISGIGSSAVQVAESYTKSYFRTSISGKRRMAPGYVLEGGLTYSTLDFDFYMRNRDDDNVAYPIVINFSEKGNAGITQAFLLARQFFSHSLFAFYGFHFLNFSLTRDQSWEPRGGLRWQASENSSWSIAYGKHSRIENLQYYLGRDHQTGGNEVQINKRLGFTRGDHFVLTFEHTFLFGHEIKVESYYQRLYNAPVQIDPSVLYSSLNEDTGFITDTLVNHGKGRNYGIEVSLEKKLSNNFYYLLNGSWYQSKFNVHDQPERNTSYNGSYSFHALAGKEYYINRDKDRIGINVKLTKAGGRPYVPIDLQQSIEQQQTIYKWEQAFEHRLPDYFRADVQVSYRMNKPRYSIECRLNLQNLTDRRNVSYYYYDSEQKLIRLKRQIGLLPLLSCRVDF